MNWFQRIAQAPTYIGVGHNYRWNENTNEYEELWQAKDSGDVIVWYHKDGKIVEQDGVSPHWVENADAKGRIESGTNRGSIAFDNEDTWVQRRVIENLVQKYPGVKFGVYVAGGPYSLQQYWDLIS